MGRISLAKLLKHKEPVSASIDGQFCEEKAININADGYLLQSLQVREKKQNKTKKT